MLEAIRRHASSLVVKILFLVLILSFIVWGVADVFRPRSQKQWIALVDDTAISITDFNQEYRESLRRIGAALGSPIDAEQARATGLPSTVLDRMVNNIVLDATSRDLGIAVSDGAVRAAILADPRFHNSAHEFDPGIFAQAVRSIGYSEQGYIDALRAEIRRSQLLAAVVRGAVPPEPLVDLMARYELEQRVGRYIGVPLPAVASVGAPDDPTLRQYHQDNPGLFTAPEYRSLTVVILDTDALARTISVSDADVQTAYAERADEFIEPERRSFEQMVFADEAAAAQAKAKLAGGAAFATVAKDMLGLKPADLSVAGVTREQLPAELAGPVYRLTVGAVSEPVRSPLGWHIVKVTEIRPAGERLFADVKEQLRTDLARDRAIDALIEQGNRLDDAIARGIPLEEAAASLGLPARKIDAIDPQGHGPDGKPLADLPPRLLETAFATPSGQESTLIEADGDTYFVVRVDQVTPVAVKPFDQIRKEVTDAWIGSRRIELAKQRAEELAARIRSDGDLEAIAKAENLKVVTTPALTRAALGKERTVPRPVADALFATPSGETFVAQGPEVFFVGRLGKVSEPPAATLAQDSAPIRQQMERGLGEDLTRQFLAAMRRDRTVKINAEALDKAL